MAGARKADKSKSKSAKKGSLPFQEFLEMVIGVLSLSLLLILLHYQEPRSQSEPVFRASLPPLVMQGGDPYIRALMRTISESEANDSRPYSILYGGAHVSDLSRHPERCVTILRGPNFGNCSTAAGRYQMINTTWYKMAQRYHPRPAQFLWQQPHYSFEPVFQDRVVYAWLSDPRAWNADISGMLRQGQIDGVLRKLSSTWTSLGYGIETNSMSRHLPAIYQKALEQELRQAR